MKIEFEGDSLRTVKLKNLAQGDTFFRRKDAPSGEIRIKTDEEDDDDDIRCVRLNVGFLSAINPDHEVYPVSAKVVVAKSSES